MKLLTSQEISTHVGDKCLLFIEQTKLSPSITSDAINGVFIAIVAGTLLKFQTKCGELLIDIKKCNLSVDSNTYSYTGPAGDIIIKFN